MSIFINKKFFALLVSLIFGALDIFASSGEARAVAKEMTGKQCRPAMKASTPISTSPSRTEDFTRFVNPMIGAGGHGHVFVGASAPFGNVQLGPTNIYKGWDWCSGYHYCDSIVIGFSHNHLSGTGCSDLGDVGIMPFTGELRAKRGSQDNISGACSALYRHAKERTSPGYYAVTLENGIFAELTATERVGMHHYRYTSAKGHHLLIDLVNDVDSRVYESYIRKVDDYTIEGYRFVKGWSPLHKTFFYAKFNHKIGSLHTFYDETLIGENELQASKVKGVVTFADDINDVIVKVALSSVSCTNAKMNMDAELPGWDFNATYSSTKAKWNEALSRIVVDGTGEEKTVFYTALYHTMMFPCLYCDVNGDFRGMDDKVYTHNKWTNYTIFSTWDTYRAFHPLLTIIGRERVPDMVNSCLSIFDQQGKLPIWPLYAGETNCMPGYSSVPIIADAYLKGIKGFDADRALHAMVATATNPLQEGVTLLMRYGYIPADYLRAH
jgi:predicted alpha-1,2-mannosidase